MGCGASFLGVAKYRAAVLGARPVARPGDHDPRNYTIVGMLGRGDGARVYLCERHNRCPGEDHCGAMRVQAILWERAWSLLFQQDPAMLMIGRITPIRCTLGCKEQPGQQQESLKLMYQWRKEQWPACIPNSSQVWALNLDGDSRAQCTVDQRPCSHACQEEYWRCVTHPLGPGQKACRREIDAGKGQQLSKICVPFCSLP